jgi:hypothetical protein
MEEDIVVNPKPIELFAALIPLLLLVLAILKQ